MARSLSEELGYASPDYQMELTRSVEDLNALRSTPISNQEERFGAWETECRTRSLAVSW